MRYTSRKKKIKRFLTVVAIVFSLIIIYSFVNLKVMPPLISISQAEAKKLAHQVIDNAVKNSISEMELKTEDFIIIYEDSNKTSANTILINELCTEVSLNINEKSPISDERKINVAIGAITGWQSLSSTGPKIGFTVRQLREADVDYETEFVAVGINQTNYKVWLNVSVSYSLVNPLVSETMVSERKVMLIDTIIEGKVPDKFLNIE